MTDVTASGAGAGDAGKTGRVLFFGRSDCNATEKALAHLRALGFDVTFVTSKGRGESLPEAVAQWDGAYIFCFRSFFVLPRSLIDRASVAAINFHPAPVEYPGSGCLNFALYDNVSQYGVTAHIMNEKVDNGAVIACRRFPVTPADTVDTLLATTHQKLLGLFFDVVTGLAAGGRPWLDKKLTESAHEKWVGEARRQKDFEKLQTISADIGADELKRIVRATYTEKFPPVLNLHGFEFVLKSPVQKT